MMGEGDREMYRPGDALFEGLTGDDIEAQRLAEALDALDDGRDPGIDPREDPRLHDLLQTASLLTDFFDDATDEPSFASFRVRSRAAVLHRSEREPEPEERPKVLPLYRRLFPMVSPIAAAAAAAGVTFFAMSGGVPDAVQTSQTVARQGPNVDVVGLDYVGVPGMPRDPVANQTALSVEEQLREFQGALTQIAMAIQRGEPVQSELLRQAAERAGAVKREIESNPAGVDGETVADYAMATANVKDLLGNAQPEPGAEGVLEAARVTAEGGFDSARRYFASRPDQIPIAPVATTPEPDAAPDTEAEPATDTTSESSTDPAAEPTPEPATPADDGSGSDADDGSEGEAPATP